MRLAAALLSRYRLRKVAIRGRDVTVCGRLWVHGRGRVEVGAATRFEGGSVGIELSHSGRSTDPFPEEQARSAAWLVASLLRMSRGRLGPSDVLGHKDLDRSPAYVGDRCRTDDCLAYVDPGGQPYRRRVDPPEGLFAALAREGVDVPRDGSERDRELIRAEAIPAAEVPRTARP